MANNSNLRVLTPEQAREIGRKGGLASVEARRKRKTLKEELLLLLSEGDTQEKMSLSIIREAINGNTKAFEIIRDTIGEKQADNVNVNGNINNPYANLSEEELKKLAGE